MLPIALSEEQVQAIFDKVESNPSYELSVDLEKNIVHDSEGFTANFEVEPARRERMLKGMDDIAATLQHEDKIAAYETANGIQ